MCEWLLQKIESAYWEGVLKGLVEEHYRETASPRADAILAGWEYELPKFVQICPKEMISRLTHPLSDSTKKKAEQTIKNTFDGLFKKKKKPVADTTAKQ